MIANFFKKSQSCVHEKITPEMDAGYCPDCGKYVENHWFITRCSCCGIKRKTVVIQGKISPEAVFCINCGSRDYAVLKLEKINPVDINYAVVVKTVVKQLKRDFIQTWVEQEIRQQLKYLTNQMA